jgi:hypothetical protein
MKLIAVRSIMFPEQLDKYLKKIEIGELHKFGI